MTIYEKRTTCRLDGSKLIDVLDLGMIKLNDFREDGSEEIEAPLTLSKGLGSNLLQLKHTVHPDLMFKNYWYKSGFNEAMCIHLSELVAEITERVGSPKTILDIGCNDGYTLGQFKEADTIGFDPSNVPITYEMTKYVNDYFSANAYWSNHTSPADIVLSIAMFYDLDDPVTFAKSVSDVLNYDGTWIIELHYLPAMLAYGGFDAICHEHLAYYNLHTLTEVMNRAGLFIVDATINNINGGSLRVTVKTKSSHISPSLCLLYKMETSLGSVEWFKSLIQINKRNTLELLQEIKESGKIVYGYGASTKGNTILQVYEITSDLLSGIAERDEFKVGKVTPGTHIPIVSEQEARVKADYFFILPYHLTNQFIKREKEFLNRGGKFIVPFPNVKVL